MADLIDRQAALDAISAWRRDYPLDLQEPIDDCWNSVRELPAVQPDHVADISKKVSISYSHENDLISRQALCKYAQNQKDKSVTPNDIMRFPSAQPETHWIPCSERMPNNQDYQLLTEEVHYTTGKIVRCVLIAYYDDEDDVWMSAEESSEAISYPIAWMPLPEPYRGGEKE